MALKKLDKNLFIIVEHGFANRQALTFFDNKDILKASLVNGRTEGNYVRRHVPAEEQHNFEKT